jgi:hypothetical protein
MEQEKETRRNSVDEEGKILKMGQLFHTKCNQEDKEKENSILYVQDVKKVREIERQEWESMW